VCDVKVAFEGSARVDCDCDYDCEQARPRRVDSSYMRTTFFVSRL
jgi:hypothetical protein